MAKDQKLIDPASKAENKKRQSDLEKDLKKVDIRSFSMKDFKQLSQDTARTPAPFDGYPLNEKVHIGEVLTPTTYVVGLNPQMFVPQDPSGKAVTITVDKRDGQAPKDKVVTLKSYHSRVLRDYDNGGENTDIVFDRTLELEDGGKITVAIVESHSLRAQLLFKLKRQGGVQVDTNYVLLDPNQSSRLRKLFGIIINPHLKVERVASSISGESEDSLDDVAGSISNNVEV